MPPCNHRITLTRHTRAYTHTHTHTHTHSLSLSLSHMFAIAVLARVHGLDVHWSR